MKSDKRQLLQGASEHLVISAMHGHLPVAPLAFKVLETLGVNTIPEPCPALPLPAPAQEALGHD